MRELEPGAGKNVCELIGVLIEAPRDLLIGRIEPQREIGGQHGRHMFLRLVEGVRDRRLGILGPPLLRPGRTLFQLPFVFEQVVEEVVAPLVGVCDQVTSGPPVMASHPTPVLYLLIQPSP